MIRLIQLKKANTRCVAVVEEPRLRPLTEFDSVYALAQAALARGTTLTALIQKHAIAEALDYDPIYCGESDWQILPPIDHSREPARCLVSGTGLTHLGSAKNREAM